MIDRAGHVAIEGLVGVRGAATLRSSPIELDPTELPRIAAELRAATRRRTPTDPPPR
jgi:hypothetical protein